MWIFPGKFPKPVRQMKASSDNLLNFGKRRTVPTQLSRNSHRIMLQFTAFLINIA